MLLREERRAGLSELLNFSVDPERAGQRAPIDRTISCALLLGGILGLDFCFRSEGGDEAPRIEDDLGTCFAGTAIEGSEESAPLNDWDSFTTFDDPSVIFCGCGPHAWNFVALVSSCESAMVVTASFVTS